MKKILMAALGLVVPATKALAQSQGGGQPLERAQTHPQEDWQATFFGLPAVALPRLTEAILLHSAQLKDLELAKLINKQDILLAKKNILGSIVPGVIYTYGNLSGVGTPDPATPNQFSTYNAARYSAAISLSLPINQIAGRSNQIEREKLALQRSEAARQDRENQIRQSVIQLYQNVLLARKLLSLQQEAFVTVQSTFRLTEKQFRQGQISLPDFSLANAQLTGVAVAQESARSQYDTAFMLLEEAAGTKISTLMTVK